MGSRSGSARPESCHRKRARKSRTETAYNFPRTTQFSVSRLRPVVSLGETKQARICADKLSSGRSTESRWVPRQYDANVLWHSTRSSNRIWLDHQTYQSYCRDFQHIFCCCLSVSATCVAHVNDIYVACRRIWELAEKVWMKNFCNLTSHYATLKKT